ncbi:hypothetical protein Sste5346_010414 [Sporothrix stenoceras]|uniref:FAD-binding domain-containing protein n=1 Tax=Sporothrix stenoceras TaxID=5173 RepID=A0ABR3YH44_9PEZI
MRKTGSPRGDAYWVNFVTNLSGERIGVLPYERMDAKVLDATPEMIHNIPQPEFEKFVAEQLENDPNVQMSKGVAYVTSTQSTDSVTATVEERSTKARWEITSRYLLACDGARSQVRKDLGIESEGDDGYETMMTIHFNADLRPVVTERVGMLHWITDPACSGLIIAYDLGGNQVLISNFDSKKHPADTWDQALARSVVTAAIGQDIPFKILSYRPWLLSRKVAKQYRQGNIFLVGDAAHSFPPTGGLGLNSGIADAHNIAYKVAAVHQGWAKDSILESYEADRRQIALVNSVQSVKNGKKIFSFLKTLGTAGIDDVQKARESLYKSIHDPAKQDMIARELEIHIGYVYGDKEAPPNASDFTPKFIPGARLPHAWIKPLHDDIFDSLKPLDVSYVKELTQADISAKQFSTLDLCRMDRFTFLVPPQEAWKGKFDEVQKQLLKAGVIVRLYVADTDFEFVDSEQKALFDNEGGFSSGKALIVRPDQHITMCPTPDTTATLMQTEILNHLGL